MRLSDFVKQSLGEITLGIAEAKMLTRDVISIAPGSLNGKTILEQSSIDFEIAVTTREISTSKGNDTVSAGFEISVLGNKVKANAGGNESEGSVNDSQKISKLTFSVPVFLNAHHRENPLENTEHEAIKDLRTKLSKV